MKVMTDAALVQAEPVKRLDFTCHLFEILNREARLQTGGGGFLLRDAT